MRPKHRRSLRRLGAALLSCVAALGLAQAVQGPARAASCYQATCNGQDPSATGCNDGAYNLSSFWYNGSSPYMQGALIELRRSGACDAAWARVTNGDCLPMWRPCGFVLEVSGGTTQVGPNPAPGAQRWSGMWSFRNYVRACFITHNWDGGYSRDGCTGWH